MQAARETGTFLAQAGLGIVYGGGRVGLMGAVADSALQHGGYVTGVMPVSLVEREIAHTGLTDLQVVENMHQRKDRMAALSSAFIALPGGAGTWKRFLSSGRGRNWASITNPARFIT